MSLEKSSLDLKVTEPYVAQQENSNIIVVPEDQETKGKAINALLIFACITVGGSSMLFGYDDKVISPIAALEPFVS